MHVISERAAIVIAAIYGGLILLLVAPMYLFSFQQPASTLIRVAGGAYIFTLLPAALIGIWLKRIGAAWMILVSIATAFALCINEVARYRAEDGVKSLIVGLVWWIFISMIPCFMGVVLLTAKKKI